MEFNYFYILMFYDLSFSVCVKVNTLHQINDNHFFNFKFKPIGLQFETEKWYNANFVDTFT